MRQTPQLPPVTRQRALAELNFLWGGVLQTHLRNTISLLKSSLKNQTKPNKNGLESKCWPYLQKNQNLVSHQVAVAGHPKSPPGSIPSHGECQWSHWQCHPATHQHSALAWTGSWGRGHGWPHPLLAPSHPCPQDKFVKHKDGKS